MNIIEEEKYQYLLGKVSTTMNVEQIYQELGINIYQVRYLPFSAATIIAIILYQYLLGKVSTGARDYISGMSLMYQYLLGKVSTRGSRCQIEFNSLLATSINIYQVRYLLDPSTDVNKKQKEFTYQYLLGKVSTRLRKYHVSKVVCVSISIR